MKMGESIEKKKKSSGTGVSPVQSFQITRRYLPHWQMPGSIYFITWRCKDSQVLSPEERTITLEAIKYWEGRKWTLCAAVVMPDHVHILGKPLPLPGGGVVNLGKVIHSVKSYSAHEIRKKRGSDGSIWQDERFDRIVRDENEFWNKLEYIRNNPVKNELVENFEDYPWLYDKIMEER
jgi:REP element-mobilizing transposase RayT